MHHGNEGEFDTESHLNFVLSNYYKWFHFNLLYTFFLFPKLASRRMTCILIRMRKITINKINS